MRAQILAALAATTIAAGCSDGTNTSTSGIGQGAPRSDAAVNPDPAMTPDAGVAMTPMPMTEAECRQLWAYVIWVNPITRDRELRWSVPTSGTGDISLNVTSVNGKCRFVSTIWAIPGIDPADQSLVHWHMEDVGFTVMDPQGPYDVVPNVS